MSDESSEAMYSKLWNYINDFSLPRWAEVILRVAVVIVLGIFVLYGLYFSIVQWGVF